MSIYVDFVDKTHLYNITTGTTTFIDIEKKFLEIPEIDGKQIYGMYNTYPSDIKERSLSTPPQTLDGPLSQSILIITDLNQLTPDAVSSYNMYNNSELGFKYAQRNSKTSVWSRIPPFRKYKYEYEKSPNIDEKNYSSATASSSSSSASTYEDKYDSETGMLRPTAPPLSSLLKKSSASSSFYPDTEEVPLTFTEEDTELIKKATDNDFDIFQTCLSSIVFDDEEDKNCLSENEALVQKLRNAILNTDIQEIISEGRSIEGVIAILNSLTTTKKGGRRKSHKKPRRKSFRKKKRRCTHHSKKNVSRR